MTVTRRQFLARSALTVGSLLLPGGAMKAFAATDPNKVIVTIFLRGAADGLNLVIPAGERRYYDARPRVAIPSGSEIAIDNFFGLHPGFAPLAPQFFGGQLAAIHAVGSPDPTRSHFSAQDYMQRAAPGDKGASDGWLNRYLAEQGYGDCYSGVTVGRSYSESLTGEVSTLLVRDPSKMALAGRADLRLLGLQQMYSDPGDPLHQEMTQALACLDQTALIPSASTGYPNTDLGANLASLAALIKADVGVRVAAVDHGSWDTHQGELSELDILVPDLAGSLATFWNDLGGHRSRTVVLIMTEFGRRVIENTSGTDHGHGSVMLVLGLTVNGGRVYLRDDVWPGLSDQDLHEGRDLQVTTDFRDVFGEILVHWMGLTADRASGVLRGHNVTSNRMLGFLA